MFNIIHLHSMIISREQNIAIKAGNGILKCLKNDKRYMKTDQHDWNFTATTKKKKKKKNPQPSQLERVNPPPPPGPSHSSSFLTWNWNPQKIQKSRT